MRKPVWPWRAWTLAWVLLVGGVPSATVTAAEVYVAPQGNDAWSGQFPEPNQDKTDGPLATLPRAVQRARELRRPDAASRIVVSGGTYYLKTPVTIEPPDSGLTIEGRGNDVILSGGRPIVDWQPYRGKILQADLADLDSPDLAFRELYCDGARMPLARVPNFDPEHPRHGGFLYNAGSGEPGNRTKLQYRAGELDPAKWSHPERAILVWWPKAYYENVWAGLKHVDPGERVLEADRGVYDVQPGDRYYVCNLLEELDAPGEWYVDPDRRRLYFWPPSEPAGDRQIVLPALGSLLVVRGDTQGGPLVEGVRIARLALRDCRNGAVQMTGAKDCTVAACDLRNVGVGVRLGDQTHGCRVVGCDVTQTLQDGVAVTGAPSRHERVSGHLIDNNYIWDFGYGDYHNRVGGVWLTGCSHCRVTHNHVHDGPRYAIGMDVGNDNEIAYNHGHHVNIETTDSGIIEAATAYHWRLPQDQELEANLKFNRGNSIHHNLLHDSGGYGPDSTGAMEYPQFCWGIYLDLHASNWHVHDNVVYNTVLGGFMLNCGIDNLVENNVFVDGQRSQIQWNPWPEYEFRGNRCERNVVSYPGKPSNLYTLRSFRDEYVAFQNNLIHAAEGKIGIAGAPDLPKDDSWDSWQKLGHDEGSVLGDPRFVDAAARDYRLQPDSPALKLGIKPIDLSRAGNYASADRRTWPRPEEKVLREPASYEPTAPAKQKQPVVRTYEECTVGQPERRAHVGEVGGLGTVRVTDETAASGRHSLKFAEVPHSGPNWQPYCTYPLELDDGVLDAGFDLRWEKGASVVYEWRDDPYQYHLGPRLAVDAEGRVTASGRQVQVLVPGQWVRFDVACGLGPQSTGKYKLTVQVPGAEPQVVGDLAHAPEFKALNCVVLLSTAPGPSTFFIDNLTFRPAKGEGREETP